MEIQLADNGKMEYAGEIPLYDYQEPAVRAMSHKSCGILQSPCGSGKTQMGIALAAALSRRTLWITHTQDLLTQSFDRAAQYLPKETLGKITAGKVHIGSHMTFATVQTLCRLDLSLYRDSWDVIIVDECHRLAGTPTQMTMFYRVMNSLAARYKYGLSATVYRSDGMIRSTFADGTLDYGKLIPYLTGNSQRNEMIVKDLLNNAVCWNLVLSDRLEHLRTLMDLLPEEYRLFAVMIDGSMTSKAGRAAREKAIEDMRNGKKHFLFASYSLAKEGLDIPRLDRLYMTTPKKDFAVVTQSIGRIARVFQGKDDAVCYDYVDSIQFCQNQFKRRRSHYRKAGCIL